MKVYGPKVDNGPVQSMPLYSVAVAMYGVTDVLKEKNSPFA